MPRTANTEQTQAWNGYEGTHWARHRDRWDAVNEGFTAPLLDAAAIGPRDHVLDIGCGTGRTTRLAARRAAEGRAVGLDLSDPVLALARESAVDEGLANVDFEQADVQVHPFAPDSFDAAISRYGVMFFADPVAAFANVARALRPGGRLAFICGAEPERNEWLQAMTALRPYLPVGDFGKPGGPGMFSMADPDDVRETLSAAGFTDIVLARTEAFGTWGRDADDAATFLLESGPGRHLTADAAPADLDKAREALVNALRTLSAPNGPGADEIRLRSVARLVTARLPE